MLKAKDIATSRLITTVTNELENITSSRDLEEIVMMGNEDMVELVLETIANSALGIHMPEAIADWLEIELTEEDVEYDYGWEAIEAAADKLAEDLTNEINRTGLPGYITFGTSEGSGDYVMFYIADIEEIAPLVGYDVKQEELALGATREAVYSDNEVVIDALLAANDHLERAESLLVHLTFNGKEVMLDKLQDLQSMLLGRMRRLERVPSK